MLCWYAKFNFECNFTKKKRGGEESAVTDDNTVFKREREVRLYEIVIAWINYKQF